jgi:glycosyltransferase involved in cell wall biosynthesis
MKISMLGTLPPLKGISYYCWQLSKALAVKIDLEFFTFSHLYPEFLYPGGTKAPETHADPADLKSAKIYRAINVYNPLTWFRTAFRISGDLVHAQFWSLPVVPIWMVIFTILRMRRKKIILTIHNVLPHESSMIDIFLTRCILYFCDLYIVHAHENAVNLVRFFHVPVTRIAEVPMGPTSTYSTYHQLTVKQARKQLGLDEDGSVLLLFGNLRDYKGADDFIRVVAHVKQKLSRKIIGLVVGQPWGSFKKNEMLIRSLGVEKDIQTRLYYIPDPQIPAYFYASDVVLLPYKHMHGQSAVGNNAMEFGIPLIVTNVGGLPDLVQNKRFVVEPNHPEQMAERVCEILTQPHLAQQLKQDVMELSRKNSWETIADRTIAVYQALLYN